MDKEKQIEEMAKVMNNIWYDEDCVRCYSHKLYNAGYGNIAELKAENESIRQNSVSHETFIEGEHIPRICPLKSLEQLKQEARREFAKEIKAEMEREKVSPSAAFICGIQHCQIVVDNLLKQYEVEE